MRQTLPEPQLKDPLNQDKAREMKAKLDEVLPNYSFFKKCFNVCGWVDGVFRQACHVHMLINLYVYTWFSISYVNVVVGNTVRHHHPASSGGVEIWRRYPLT